MWEKAVHTGAESSGTKSCRFSEEGQKGHCVRCLSVCEGSCFQEMNTKGSPVPLGKGQLLESNPLSKNTALTPAFLPGFLYDYEWKGFFLFSTGIGKLLPAVSAQIKRTCPRKLVKIETATWAEICERSLELPVWAWILNLSPEVTGKKSNGSESTGTRCYEVQLMASTWTHCRVLGEEPIFFPFPYDSSINVKNH